ncbi:hypothetical protein QFC21_001613 [Naganishia friedmannii]|uniref:Uncharacterized protein n=1 Tax=Naganishia friedmannii TaxID=89922 RepID=A0ACC2W0V6_9TREE|nr:hypothetical protein QFC21_001613 [Naganishia friedmannii]
MDDVEDDSQLRRGIPVTHKIFGVPQTINTANYVYFQAYQELFKFRRKHRDGMTRDGQDSTPTQDSEICLDEVITGKCKASSLKYEPPHTEAQPLPHLEELINLHRGQGLDLFWRDSLTDYVPLVNLISILFQIRDDYMNLESTEYGGNKGYCEDLTEGKFSFPVVHAVRNSEGDRQILSKPIRRNK